MRAHLNWILTLWIVIFVSGCGFQLNRNQVKLPSNADNVQIKQIQNRSFRPGLDLKFEQLLNSQLSNRGIVQTSSSLADLTLDFTILNTTSSKVEHSLQSGSQTYLFSFNISGTLSLRDNRNNSFIYRGLNLQSSSALETNSADLTDVEIDSGYQKSLGELSKKVIAKLIQTF